MDINALTLLVEILDAGSMSEAARRLKMSRANVSSRLNQLERSVGLQLVRRTTRRVAPTEVGARLYQHGRVIKDELAAARESLSVLGTSLQGRIRLGVPSGYGQLVMAEWLIEFKRCYPDIVLDVMFENRIVDLMQDEVDIAVRVLSEPPLSLVARSLGTVRYVACATPVFLQTHGLPTQLSQLEQLPLVTSGVIGRELKLNAYLDHAQHEVALAPTLMSENFPFLRQAVLAGIGIGLVPDYVVEEDIRSGALVTALDDWRLSIFGTNMYLLYMPNRRPTRAMSTFIEFILAQTAACKHGEPQCVD